MTEIKIQGVAHSDRIEYGIATVQDFAKNKLVWRSLKILGIFWAIALFCILIPMLHFVLVPLFLLLGVIFAILNLQHRQEIISGELSCPHCSAKISLKSAPLSWPHKEICQKCSSWVRISPA